MKLFTQILIEGIIVFILVFLLNYFMFVRKNKKLTKDEMPLELIYLSGIYGINPKLISFRKFQYTYSLINSFIITLTYLIVMYLIKTMIIIVIMVILIINSVMNSYVSFIDYNLLRTTRTLLFI